MSVYKIKELELLSGIKAHTIRMWEKRYGILNPSRTDTQIRTYNDDDLTSLLNISILNQQGVKISKIAKMSGDELKEGVKQLSLEQHQESAVISIFMGALIEMDEEVFMRMVESLIHKEGLTTTYFNYFLPFLERMGTMWLVGTIIPAQEHFVTALIRNIIVEETAKLPFSQKLEYYLLFCRPAEYHDISLLFYNYLLRKAGNSTLYLGQNVPLSSLGPVLRLKKIKACVTATVTPLNADELKETEHVFRSLNCPIYIGGGSSSQLLAKKIPHIFPVQDLLIVEH